MLFYGGGGGGQNEEQIKSYCSTKINNNPNIDRTHNEQIQRDVCYKVVDKT